MVNVQKAWLDEQIRQRDEEGIKPTACNTPHRVSDVQSCVRKLTLTAHKARESEEFTSNTFMNFLIGNAIHESIQESLEQVGWHFEAEVPIDLTEASKKVGHGIEEFGLSGHADGIITHEDNTRTVVEIKSVGGFAAKKSWPYPGNGEGPKREHWAQGALYAVGAEADAVMIVYVAKESDYRAGIKAGDIMQWERGLHEVHPDGGQSLYDIAMDELRHFQYADRYYRKGMIAPAFVPNDHGELELIHDRPEYMAKKGNWRCRYCMFNTVCRSLPADEEVPVEMVDRVQHANA